MSVSDFMFLCAAIFALIYLGVRLYDDTHPAERTTVENENDACREVVSMLGQHHPTVDDDEDSIPFLLDTIDERDAWLARHGIGKGHIA